MYILEKDNVLDKDVVFSGEHIEFTDRDEAVSYLVKTMERGFREKGADFIRSVRHPDQFLPGMMCVNTNSGIKRLRIGTEGKFWSKEQPVFK